MKVENYLIAGSGFRRKEGRDGGINRKKLAGWWDLRTLFVDPQRKVCRCQV